MGRVYDGRNFRRPRQCDCGKVRYRDEGAALAAAERRGAESGSGLRAYRCPGTSAWHLTARGFRPSSLKSDARILAWHVHVSRVTTRQQLRAKFGIKGDQDSWTAPERNKAKKLSAILGELAALGLAQLGERGTVTAADDAGLLRVMAVGLQEYAASRRASPVPPASSPG